MFALSEYPINYINTSKALSLLQHHLQEVAKHQRVSEVSTNNILAGFITQLQDLQALISNPTLRYADVPLLQPPSRSCLSAKIPATRALLHHSRLNIWLSVD